MSDAFHKFSFSSAVKHCLWRWSVANCSSCWCVVSMSKSHQCCFCEATKIFRLLCGASGFLHFPVVPLPTPICRRRLQAKHTNSKIYNQGCSAEKSVGTAFSHEIKRKTATNSSKKVSTRLQKFPHWIFLFHCKLLTSSANLRVASTSMRLQPCFYSILSKSSDNVPTPIPPVWNW